MKRNKVWVNKRSTATHYLNEAEPSLTMCGHEAGLNEDDIKKLSKYLQIKLTTSEICDGCQAAERKLKI